MEKQDLLWVGTNRRGGGVGLFSNSDDPYSCSGMMAGATARIEATKNKKPCCAIFRARLARQEYRVDVIQD